MKSSKWIIILSLAIIFCLTVCKGKVQKAEVETIEGITYVHNPAMPLHPNRTLSLEMDLVYEEKDEKGEVRLFDPGRIAVDAEGRVYIGDNTDMAIKVFDLQGKYLRTISRKGEGPGEFTFIGDIIPLPDGKLLTSDPQSRRISFFAPDGEYLAGFQWTKNLGRVYLATETSYTLEESVITEKAWEPWIKTIDFAGKELRSFGKFNSPELKTVRINGGAVTFPAPWSPASVFAADQTRQWLYHCPGDKYLIEVYDQDGKLFRKADRPYEPVQVTGADIDELRARFADRPDSPMARIYQQMEFPKVKPICNRMIVDSNGNLWVRTNEVKKEGGKEMAAYDIFSPEGFYDARVWLAVIPSVFAGGKMYLIDENEESGLRQVKRYRVIWKES